MGVRWRVTATIVALLLGGSARSGEPIAEPPPAIEEVAPLLGPASMSLEAARLDETIRKIRDRSEPPWDVRAIVDGLDTDEAAITEAAMTTRGRLQAPDAAAEIRDARATWSLTVDRLDRDQRELEDYAARMGEDLATLEEVHARWTAGRAALPADTPPALVVQTDQAIAAIAAVRDEVRPRNHDALQAVLRVAALRGTAATVLDALDQAVRDVLFAREAPLWSIQARPNADLDARAVAVAGALQRGQDVAVYVVDAPWRPLVQLFLGLVAAWLFFRARRISDERLPTRKHLSWEALVHRPLSSAIVLSLGVGTILHVRAPSAFLDVLVLIAIVPLARTLRVLIPGVALQPLYLLFAVYVVNRSVALLAGAEAVYRVVLVAADLLALVVMVWAVRALARRAALAGQPSARLLRWLLFASVAAFAAAVVANIVGFVSLATVIVDGSVEALYVAGVLWTTVALLDGCVRFASRLPAAQRLGMISHHGDYVEDRLGRLLRFLGGVAWAAYVLSLLSLLQPLSEGLVGLLAAQLTVGAITVTLRGVVVFVVSVWAAVSVSRLIRFMLDEDVLPRMQLPKGVPATVSTLTHYGVLTAGLLMAVAAAGVHLEQFAFAAGALGIGIGFGLQGIVNNVVSGLVLLFERPIQVGDVIELGALTGTVKRVGIRACRVRTLDGAEVIVPNSDLITDAVVNWTLSDRVRRFELAVGVAYGSRTERVLALLAEVARGTPGVLAHPEPVVLMDAFGASSLDFVVQAWAHYDEHIAVRSATRVRIEAALREAGIEIPFPQRDLHLRSDAAEVPRVEPVGASAA